MKYRHSRDNPIFQYFDKMILVGDYGMPLIFPINKCDIKNLKPFNYANSCKNPEQTHICFYVDDYQFERIWNEPVKACKLLKHFKGIIAPDFSLYRDFPKALQIFNCWRNKALTWFFQMNGIEVIPNVSWSDESSYSWCFDGLPQNSVVAVCTNGCLSDKTAKDLFLKGFEEMKKRLNPSRVLIIGSVPKELQSDLDIVQYLGYSSLFGKQNKNLAYKGGT